MKKRILLMIFAFVCLVTLTGCGSNEVNSKKQKLTYSDEILKLTTIFEYDKEDGFEFVKNIDGGKYAEIEFVNTKENLAFDMYYTTGSKTMVDNNKETRSAQKYYKEYTFDKYSAYVYSEYSSNLYLVIDLDEKDDNVTELFIAIEQNEFKQDDVVFDIFNKDVIQNFFKSIKIEEKK